MYRGVGLPQSFWKFAAWTASVDSSTCFTLPGLSWTVGYALVALCAVFFRFKSLLAVVDSIGLADLLTLQVDQRVWILQNACASFKSSSVSSMAVSSMILIGSSTPASAARIQYAQHVPVPPAGCPCFEVNRMPRG